MKTAGRVVVRILLFAALAASFASVSASHASAQTTNFSAGSLIIPMDTDTSGNHAAYNQNTGMWKAYGLLYRLLDNGIPVSWAIDDTKTTTTTVDFTASSVKDLRTSTALGSWSYKGGAFVIDSANATAAKALINAWWAQNTNLPNVHEANNSFVAPTPVVLRSPPRIANEEINSGISIAYYNAAGIPDLLGNTWTSSSPNILGEQEIADGGLFTQGACLEKKFDTFVTPHNSGYSYSLTDPSNLGTKTYAQLDTFVHQGGGWTALCHSLQSNEDFIADLTLNGSPSVKALFKTSEPGGKPGGFLTETGFPSITNDGGTWGVNPGGAKLPTAQLVPTTVANPLPGGSVQSWPSTGIDAPTYWSETERVASFTDGGDVSDHIIAGSYHDGTGAGKLTYIGGHSYATSTPYANNSEGPYLRAFYNSLFFNGTAKPQLEFSAPSTYPQNGTANIQASLTNIGGSTAVNVNNTTVVLEPGFSYVGTTSGPAPSVSGQTLTWANLGDLPGGASAVTVELSVGPSISSTPGQKKIGTVKASYGDVFGEGFTGVFCRELTIVPVPVPKLTKTPATQGPVSPGTPVTWTLTYGNTGSASLLGSLVEDTLPPGFTYISSTSSPSLGAPTVIPGAQIKVRWTAGTIPANTPSAGTVTITARAGAVTNGTGDPLQQTFNNGATLSGTGTGGTPYDTSASATVDVIQGSLSLNKTVDKAFVQTPGEVTYTLTPSYNAATALTNARVIDPLPAGVTSPPITIGQGGTFGPYIPLAAENGNDVGPPVLDTAMTVSSNFRTLGQSVTVTMNVKSSTAVAAVTPDLSSTGGNDGCGAPVPASANVPAGAVGVNFVWTCTPVDNGEYVFFGSASNNVDTDWPQARSSSVLVAPSGGPNVVTWNLGSTTAAIPGETIITGYKSGVFALHGNSEMTFRKYETGPAAWIDRADTLADVGAGGALTNDGAGKVYAMRGDNTQAFWVYDVATNTWTAKANVGTNVREGGALVYLNGFVYATTGNGTGFRRYDPGANTWIARAATPQNIKWGGALTTDGTYIYATRGDNKSDFYRYDPVANTWTSMAPLPATVKAGGSLTRVGNYIYALRGNGKTGFYRYDIVANTWSTLAVTPGNVKNGGALATDGTSIYALQGDGKTGYWRYNIATGVWTTLAPTSSVVKDGGALTYVTASNLTGLFSDLTVNKSLTTTGESLKVTMEFAADPPVNNIVAGALTTTATGGASCSSLTGPVLVSADTNSTGLNDPVRYEWTCTVAAGSNPGSLKFSAGGTGAGPVTFPTATSNSSIVSPLLTFKVGVPNGAPDPVTNTAVIGSRDGSAASPTVETATGTPNLSIVKSNTPGPAAILRPGDGIAYSMMVENSGTVPATNVTVSDVVPAGVTYVMCTGGVSCSESAGTVTWDIGTMNPGDMQTVGFTVITNQDLPVSNTDYIIANKASVDSDETSPVDSNEVTNRLRVLPSITKAVSAVDAVYGQTLTYTMQVNNPGAAFTANVTDVVPTGTSFNGVGTCSPACTFSAGTVTWAAQNIAPGPTVFSFDVTVTGAAGDEIVNQAVLDPQTPNLDPIPSNEVVTEVGEVNLAINKSHSGNFTQGQIGAQYTIAVSNNGPDDTLGLVTVTDTLPAGLTATAISGTGWTCVLGTLTCTRNDVLAAGNSYPPITLTVNVASNAGTPLVNSATASGGGDPTPVTDNDPTVIDGVNLAINKSHTGDFTQGQTGAQYNIAVSNTGPSPTSGTVTVTDTLPAGLTATAISGTGWTCVLGTLTCTRNDVLGAGNNYPPITLTVNVANNAGSPLVNSATASGGGDPTPQTDTDPTIVRSINLAINKSHTGDFTQGQNGAQYNIAVSNLGPDPTSGVVTVTDTLPAGLTATAISGTGWTCVLGTLTCTRNDVLGAGNNYPPITLTVNVANNAGSPLVNSATASGGGDPTPQTDDDPTIVRSINLAINKSHTGDFTQGQNGAQYNIAVSNLGPDPTSGVVTVTDTLPAGLTATAISGTGWTCVLGTLTCTRNDVLGAGNNYPPITLTVNVANNAGSPLVNSATASGGGDPTPQTDDDPTIVRSINLAINKSHTGDFTQGQNGAQYNIAVSNLGPDPTSGVVTVTDTLPAGLTATAISGTGWTCVLGTLTCTRNDVLGAGNNYPPITLTVNVANNAGSPLVNSATASGGGDPTPQTDTDPTIVRSINLAINKSHTGDFTQGQNGAQYNIAVSNLGPDPTSGVVTVTDTLPAGLTATAISGTGWTCVLGTLTCTRNDVLGAGNNYPPITLTVNVANNAGSPLVNSATASGGGDPTPQTDTDPTIVRSINLAINKSHTGDFTQGQNGAQYNIAVSNLGPDPTSGVVTVTDTLPAGLTATAISGTGWTCVLGTLTCTRNDVLGAGNNYPPITLTVNVANNAGSPLVNSATASGGGDPTPQTDDDPTIVRSINLAINKSHTGDFTQGQNGAQYNIAVSNLGPDPTSGVVTVTDTLPAGLTATAISGTGWTCVLGTLTCTRNDVLGAGNNYPPITLTVNVANNAGSPLVNSATASGGGDPTPQTDDDPTIVRSINLAINKSHTGDFTQGQNGAQYNIAVSNLGPDPTSGVVTVTDTLPAGLTATAISGTGWTCVLGTLTCTRNDVLGAGNNYPPITLTVNVANNAGSPLVNSATASGGGDPTPQTDDDPTIVRSINLAINKSHTGDFTQGQNGAQYNIAVSNLGPDPTSGVVTVTDTLPAGLTATAISGTGWTCVLGTLTCTRNDVLGAGNNYPPITLTVNVANNAGSPLVNSATASGGGDPTPQTDTDPTIVRSINLAINKSHTGDFTQGQNGAQYNIAVSNLGPDPTSGVVTVTDTLPAGLTATAISGTGWTCVLGTLTCTRNDVLGAGNNYPPITLTVNVANNAGSPLVNSATASGGGDPTPQTDTDPTIVRSINLAINKSHTGDFTQGQNGAQYNIAVSNLGPDPTSGVVTVTDTLPAGLTATAISGTGWTCVLGTLTCTRNDVLGAGNNYPPITLTVNVANNAGSPLVNSATASGGGDPTPQTDTDPTIVRSINLAINKSHTGDFTQGQNGAQYNIAVSNLGPDPTSGVVTVTDTLPAGLTATAISGTGWTCVLGTLTCTRNDVLGAGNNYPPITLTVNVANNAGSPLVNSATASGGGDPTPQTDDDPTIVRSINLAINKSHTGDFTQGQNGAQYNIAVSNLGPDPTSGVVTVTDTLPAGLTATAISGTGWTCVLGTLTCTRNDVLGAGNNYPPITLTVNVANNAGSPLVNSATASGGGDPTPVTDTDPTIVRSINLAINKSHTGDFTQGQNGAQYNIAVSNLGPDPTSGVVTVTDTLPAGLTATAISGTGWTCVLGTLTCTRNDVLGAGNNYPPITLTVNVANNAGSPLVNSATASGGGDPTPQTDTDPTIVRSINLAINKSHTGDFTQGQNGAQYNIAVSNLGPDPTSGVVTVTDTLPAGLTATAISGTGWTCVLGTLTCTRNDVLGAGNNYPPITLTVNVANNAGSPLVNSATASGGGDPTPVTDNDPTIIEVLAADVEITKTATPAVVSYGDTVTYQLKAKNNGPGNATNVVVTDPLPNGVSFISADAPCLLVSVTVTCQLGTLVPGQEIILEVKVKVDAAAPGDPNLEHMLDVQKVEAQIDIDAGQQRTVSVTCPSGYFVSDGSVRIDNIDHGTGDWPTAQVLESRASSLDTWQGTVRNTAMGRVQAKVFAVCIKQTTNPVDGHTHDLIVSNPITVTHNAPIGNDEATLQCAPGQVAIQPGFQSSGAGNLVYSEPEGDGWKFIFDVKEPSVVTYSIRCLSKKTSSTSGHDHDLKFEHIMNEVTIQPGTVNEAQLTCADGSKGIVADMDLDEGLVSLGNDPRPVTRAFKLYNPTMNPLTARISLLCLGDRTGGHSIGPIQIINTAYISTTSDDQNQANNQSSATITVVATPTDVPVPDVPTVKPTPNNPIGMSLGGDANFGGQSVAINVTCTGPCSGAAKLATASKVKVGGKKYKKGTLLAKGSFKIDQAGTFKIKLKTTFKGKKIFKARKKSRGLLTLTGGARKMVTIK